MLHFAAQLFSDLNSRGREFCLPGIQVILCSGQVQRFSGTSRSGKTEVILSDGQRKVLTVFILLVIAHIELLIVIG